MPKSIASSGLILQQKSPNDIEGFPAAAGAHGQRARGAQQCWGTRGPTAGAVTGGEHVSPPPVPRSGRLRASRHSASPCPWGTSSASSPAC